MIRKIASGVAIVACLAGSWLLVRPSRAVVPAAPIDKIYACRAERSEREQMQYAALDRSQRRVIANVRRSRPDPAGDAARAARDGEWGLIRTYEMFGTFPYGVECTDGEGNFSNKPLVAAYRVFSDIPGSCETMASGKDCSVDRALDAYAPEYNRALVTHPAYPYRDICRAVPQPVARDRRDAGMSPLTLGFRPLADPDNPRTVAEAARRGDLRALPTMVRADPASLDRADPYAVTPLGWAVLYRQPEAARWLAARGASPVGDSCSTVDTAQAPFRLALQTGQDAVAQMLYRVMTPAQRPASWSSGTIEAAVQGGADRFLEQVLASPHRHSQPVDAPRASTRAILSRHEADLCWRTPVAANVRVGMIAIYGAPKPPSPIQHNPNPGEVTVEVTSGGPVLLVLSAYDGTRWTVRIARGTKLTGVIALGYDPQLVLGVPPGVRVVRNDLHDHCARLTQPWAGSDEAEREALARDVERIIGHEVERLPIPKVTRENSAPYRIRV